MIEAIVLRCFYHNNTPIYKYRQTNQNKILSMHCQFRYFRHKNSRLQKPCKRLFYGGCGGWIWTNDLRVMSIASSISPHSKSYKIIVSAWFSDLALPIWYRLFFCFFILSRVWIRVQNTFFSILWFFNKSLIRLYHFY